MNFKMKHIASIRYPDDTAKEVVKFVTTDGRVLTKFLDTNTFDDPRLLHKALRGFLCDFDKAQEAMGVSTIQEALEKLQANKSKRVKHVATQRGWQEERLAFLAPTGMLGTDAKHYAVDDSYFKVETVQPVGDMAVWQRIITQAMHVSPVLTASIGMALATPMMKWLGSNTNRLIILVGPTSSGKTTVEQALMSIFASPDPMKLYTFNMSGTALSNYMAKFCDIPTIVDELGTLAQKGVSAQDKLLDMVYEVASQSGRLRHDKAGYATEISRTLVFTSSESVIHYQKGGQRVRMLNLAAAEPKGFGIFTKHIGGKNLASLMFGKLLKTIEQNHALAGPMFVSELIAEISAVGPEVFSAQLRKKAKRALAEIGVGDASANKRAAEPFAWALLALRMAIAYKVLPGLDDAWAVKAITKSYSRSCRLLDAEAEERRLYKVKLFKKIATEAAPPAQGGTCKKGSFAWLSDGDYYIRRKTLHEWLKAKVGNKVMRARIAEDIELLGGKVQGKNWTYSRELLGKDDRTRYIQLRAAMLESYTIKAKK